MSIDSALLRAILGDNTLLAEAAEISKETITVDLHCHPNASGRGHFPRFDPEVPANMRAGGLDLGDCSRRAVTIRRSDAIPRAGVTESRKPREERIASPKHGSNSTRFLKPPKKEKSPLPDRPAEIVEAKKRATPCAVLAIEGSDPLEGDLSRVSSLL